jgi:hypothetical protein
VRFETTLAFDADYRRLKHSAEFKKVVRETFVPACDVYANDPRHPGRRPCESSRSASPTACWR